MKSSAAHFYIVTPSYNQAQFITQTIESVLDQDGDFTVDYCVMDGGSTDGTTDVLKKFGKKIFWHSKKDNGQTDAINKGIIHLRKIWQKRLKNDSGSDLHIFAYINSDDYYLPKAFATVAQCFAEQPEKMWLVGDAVIIDAEGGRIQEPVRWYKKFWRWLYNETVLHILNPIPQPSTFIRMSALNKIGEFTTGLNYVMDYDFWLRLQSKLDSPLMIAQPLAAFRIHGQSKGGSSFRKQFEEQLLVAKKYNKTRLVILLHQLHNWLITMTYNILK